MRPGDRKEQSMNQLSERNVQLLVRIRNAHAELDPVPEDVLAAARDALRQGLPAMPFGAATSCPRVGESESPNGC
jgi:hypothetical protein